MHNFNPHEEYTADAKKHAPVDADLKEEQALENEKRKENMLQMGWLARRIDAIINDEEVLKMKLQELAVSDPSISERIEQAESKSDKDVMLQTIIIEHMLAHSEDARWFRIHFPGGRKEPLAPEYQLILDSFEDDPDFAIRELDRLFSESLTKQ